MANSKIEKAVEKGKFAPLAKMAAGRDAALRLEALENIGKVPGEESFNLLVAHLRSSDGEMRAAAAKGLGYLKSDKSRAFIEHQLSQESDTGAAEAMRHALTQIPKS